MFAAIELETLPTQRCRECGNSHLIRAELVADERQTAPALVGFFGECPQNGARAWFVVEAPERPEPVRLARLGPIDDRDWEPDPAEGFDPTPDESLAPRLPPSPSGTKNGGFRIAARRPDVLRRAWGCPFYS